MDTIEYLICSRDAVYQDYSDDPRFEGLGEDDRVCVIYRPAGFVGWQFGDVTILGFPDEGQARKFVSRKSGWIERN